MSAFEDTLCNGCPLAMWIGVKNEGTCCYCTACGMVTFNSVGREFGKQNTGVISHCTAYDKARSEAIGMMNEQELEQELKKAKDTLDSLENSQHQ